MQTTRLIPAPLCRMQWDALKATTELEQIGFTVISAYAAGHDPRPTVQVAYAPEMQGWVRAGFARRATLRNNVKQIEWDMDGVLVIAIEPQGIEPKEASDGTTHH